MLAPPRLDAASDAAATTLLNCYLREGGDGDVRRRPRGLPGARRRGGPHPPLGDPAPPLRAAPVEPVRSWRAGSRAALDPGEPPEALLGRVETSLDVRAGLPRGAPRRRAAVDAGPLSFIETEQALVLGHPLHPTPKGLCGPARAVRAGAAAALPAALAVGRRAGASSTTARPARPRRSCRALLGTRTRRAASCSPRTRGRPATSRAPCRGLFASAT